MGHCYHHALSSVKKWGGVATTICRCTNGSMNPKRSLRIFGIAHCAITPKASSCWLYGHASPA